MRLRNFLHPRRARRLRQLDRPGDATTPMLNGPGAWETTEQRAANSLVPFPSWSSDPNWNNPGIRSGL